MSFFQNLDDVSIGRKGAALIFIPTFVLMLSGLAVWRFHISLVKDQNEVFHSKQILILSEELLNELARAQNDIWAFALSEHSDLDESARGHLTRFRTMFYDLRTLITDSSIQQDRLGALIPILDQVDSQALTISNAIRQGKREIVIDALSELPIYQRTKQLREAFEDFIGEEHRLADLRAEKLVESTRRLLTGFLVGICFSSISSLILGRMFANNITARVQNIIVNFTKVSGGKRLGDASQGQDEIGQIDRALHQMAETLIERDQEMELFIYSVSHDLRSPLLNLQGFAQELKICSEDLRGKLAALPDTSTASINKILDEDFDLSVRYIQSAIQRLSTIMNALLQLSRVARLEFRYEQIELSAVFTRIIDALNVSIEEKGAQIKLLPLSTIWGDPESLERAFGNLLSNAIDYLDSERPGIIEIGILNAQRNTSSNFLTLYIKDNGLGFPEGGREKVFLPFQRFHRDISKGEGIGLALVRKIILRNHGKIWFKTKNGVGTTFFLSLPTAKLEPVIHLVERLES